MENRIPMISNRQSTQHHLKNPRLTTIPMDVFFCICILLDFETIFKMKSLSQHMERRINRLLMNINFLEKISVLSALNLNEEQIRNISTGHTGCNALMPIASQIIQENISDVSKNHYPYHIHYRVQTGFPFFNTRKPISLFKGFYSEFTLNEIQPFIVRDEASNLLRKVSRVAVQDFDLRVMRNTLIQLPGELLSTRDVEFIGLIPVLIRFKAFNCFDLFIQVYLCIHARGHTEIENSLQFSFKVIRNLILHSKDDYFINRFISWMMKLYPAEEIYLYDLIDFAFKNNRKQVILRFGPHLGQKGTNL